MHLIDMSNKAKGRAGVAIPLPFVEGTLAVLGLLSLLVNAIFCVVMIVLMAAKKGKQIPRWIVIFNFIALLAEIYWYFLDK
jgi:hypothetical protein